jgi:hypothetical protein
LLLFFFFFFFFFSAPRWCSELSGSVRHETAVRKRRLHFVPISWVASGPSSFVVVEIG